MAGPFKKLLATELVEYFGKSVTPTLGALANKALQDIEHLTVHVAPASFDSNVPVGSGNEWSYRSRKFYGEPPANQDADYVLKGEILNFSYDFTDFPNWLVDDTLNTVEWEVTSPGVEIASIVTGTTKTTAELTFNEIGGYTVTITATKNASTDKIKYTKNFIVTDVSNSYLRP
jgi:hypothetical protein